MSPSETTLSMTGASHDRLFHSAFESAAIGMALVGPDGRFMMVNPSICKSVGYSEDELLKLTFQDITHPDDLDLDLANLAQLSAGHISTYQMEKRYFHKEGRIIWVNLSVSAARDDDGKVRFYISQIEDITARKEAERVRETLFELPLALHFVVDFAGRFQKLSPSWSDTLGYPMEEMLKFSFLDCVHPDDLEQTRAEADAIRQGTSSALFENRYRCADGSYRWLYWAAIAVPEQQLVYGVAIDFTARKGLELNLRLALEDRDRLIRQLESSARQNEKLRDQLVTICAWTHRIFHDGRWMSTDEFLGDYLGLNLTHGISEEGKALFLSEEHPELAGVSDLPKKATR